MVEGVDAETRKLHSATEAIKDLGAKEKKIGELGVFETILPCVPVVSSLTCIEPVSLDLKAGDWIWSLLGH